jgi:VWFA-related protein
VHTCHICRIVLLAVLACALASGSVLAQNKPAAAPQDPQNEPTQTFRVEVDVVNVFFNVKDKRGALIPDLKREDFVVKEDGAPQTVKFFTAETEQPLTLGLLIDTSGSQAGVLQSEKEVGASFLDNVIRPKDLAFVISFDVNVDLLQDFTSAKRELRAALDRARINTGGLVVGGPPGMGGGPVPISNPKGTLLYDGIYLAAEEKLAREVGRKAMIILTDGEDVGSRLTIANAIEAAQKADAICYVLLIVDNRFYDDGRLPYSGKSEMKRLAEETGGRLIDVGHKHEDIRKAFDQIANELRTQYSIGYTPTNTVRDGAFRRIEISAKKGMKVQARKGYYARKN